MPKDVEAVRSTLTSEVEMEHDTARDEICPCCNERLHLGQVWGEFEGETYHFTCIAALVDDAQRQHMLSQTVQNRKLLNHIK